MYQTEQGVMPFRTSQGATAPIHCILQFQVSGHSEYSWEIPGLDSCCSGRVWNRHGDVPGWGTCRRICRLHAQTRSSSSMIPPNC